METESKEVKIESEDVPIIVKPAPDSPLNRIVKPHTKVSRPVTEADVDKVVEDAQVLHAICFEKIGIYNGAFAMHHSQIDDKDPLDFFVLVDRKIVINPVVTRTSAYTKPSKEGCMSFGHMRPLEVERYQKMDVKYVTIMSDPNTDPDTVNGFKLSAPIQEKLSGRLAWIFQHEMDHAKGKFVYQVPKEEKKQIKL